MMNHSESEQPARGMPAGDEGAAGWPSVDYEQIPWETGAAAPSSRRQRRLAAGPYQAAIPAQIANRILSLDGATVAEAEDAVRELTRFDTSVGMIAAPFSSILLRSESASSSMIENLTSGPQAIALAELGAASSPNAHLIVDNVHALEAAIALAETLEPETVIEMHRALLERTQPRTVGHWRREQVWLGGTSISPHGAAFVPPHESRVPGLMADVMRFAVRDDLPLLPQIAVAHAQFETIHPFPDGNGRTGRALVQAMLRSSGVTEQVTVPVSAGLLRDTDTYFQALTAYRTGDLAPIVSAITVASLAAVDNGRRLVGELQRVRLDWDARLRVRSDSAARRLLDVLQRRLVVTSAVVQTELEVSERTALTTIDQLVNAHILVKIGAARRNRVWKAQEVLDALESFAARSRRG